VETIHGNTILKGKSSNWFRDWYCYQHKLCFVNQVNANVLLCKLCWFMFYYTYCCFPYLLANSFRFKVQIQLWLPVVTWLSFFYLWIWQTDMDQ